MDSLFSGVKDMTSKVADAAVSGVQKVGDATKAGLNAAKDGVTAVSDGVVSGASRVGDATMSGLNHAKDGAMAGVNAASAGVGSVAGGFTSSFATMTVLKAETKAKIVGLSPLIVAKVGRIINNMKASEYQFTDDEIDLVVKSIYVSQSDADLQAAFDMFDKKLNGNSEGRLKGSDFRVVLPLVGEDLPADKIDELFKEVDKDQSGNIEFEEFKTLMLAMNPPTEGATSKVFGGISSFTSGVASGVMGSITTLTVLKANTKAKLMGASPFAMAKIGRIIKHMQESEYKFTDDEVDDVVKALYVTQTDEDFQKVFDMFDRRLNNGAELVGHLTAQTFRNVLPLVGEDVPAEKIDELFKEMDTDGSGNIEFAEFKAMMLAMNPKAA